MVSLSVDFKYVLLFFILFYLYDNYLRNRRIEALDNFMNKVTKPTNEQQLLMR